MKHTFTEGNLSQKKSEGNVYYARNYKMFMDLHLACMKADESWRDLCIRTELLFCNVNSVGKFRTREKKEIERVKCA